MRIPKLGETVTFDKHPSGAPTKGTGKIVTVNILNEDKPNPVLDDVEVDFGKGGRWFATLGEYQEATKYDD